MPGKWSTNRGLVSTAAEGIADRSPDPERFVGAEGVSGAACLGVVVILDVVVVNLRTDKNMAPDVKANAASDVRHEVVGADVVDTTAARGARDVEAVIASADASHQVEAKSLTQMRLVEEVEVGQDRTKVLLPGEVDALSSPPGGFDIKAELLDGKHVAADVEISAAAHRRAVVVGRRRQKGAAAHKDVDLLGRGKLGEKQEQRD